jgi:hypothetical protein
MSWRSGWRWVAVRIVTLSTLLWLAGLLNPSFALAEGGLALSGSFHGQNFVIPQGASVSGPSIDLVIFNNSNEAMNIRMLGQGPGGVSISFSNQQFTIQAGGQQRVLLTVTVAAETAPGNYDLSVTAQSYKEGATGIQLAGAAGQTAKLTVTGDSAKVALRALSPDGQPLVAAVRLFRVFNGQSQEVAYNETGTLQATVTPGEFKAVSYIGGQQVAEQSFTLAKGDNKRIDLTGATVYFASFGVLAAYANDTGKLAFVQVVYTVKNIYQQVNKGDVILQTTFNGKSLAAVTLITLSPLAVGSSGLNYNYTPTEGWGSGSYDFQLQLNLDGKLYTSSTVEHLTAGGGEATTAGTSPTVSSNGTSPVKSSSPSATSTTKGISPYLFGGIIAAVVVVACVLIFWFRRKR